METPGETSRHGNDAQSLPVTQRRRKQTQYRETEESVEKHATALRLRGRGWTYEEIASELGYHTRSAAFKAVQAALKRSGRLAVEDVREEMAIQLENLYRVVSGVIDRDHLVVDKGAVVEYEGKPLLDDGPKLAAVGQSRQLLERMSKLFGADAPQKTQVEIARVDFTLDGIPASEV